MRSSSFVGAGLVVEIYLEYSEYCYKQAEVDIYAYKLKTISYHLNTDSSTSNGRASCQLPGDNFESIHFFICLETAIPEHLNEA